MADYIASDLDSDNKNSWGTDPLVFAALDSEFDFSLDAAASETNHLVELYLTQYNCAIKADWSVYIDEYNQEFTTTSNKNVWVNPPYGRGMITKFMQKAVEERENGVTTVMLVPATLDAQWLPLAHVSEIRIVTNGRLSFVNPLTKNKIAGNTKGSMFVIFRPSSSPLVTRYVDRNELLALGKQNLANKAIIKEVA